MSKRMTAEPHEFIEDHHRPDTVAPYWLCQYCGKRKSAKAHRTTTEESPMKITVGYTRSDRSDEARAAGTDYVPSMDGYRPGAAQDVLEFELDTELDHPEPDWQALQVADAVFTATNAPYEVIASQPLAMAVRKAMADSFIAKQPELPRLSLSVGDTVEVEGARLACDRVGWKVVPAGE